VTVVDITDILLPANNKSATLNNDLLAGDSSIVLTTGEGATWPSPSPTEFFILTVQDLTTGLFEICYCTARSGDLLTVDRAQEGTTALTFSAATSVVQMRLTKGLIEKHIQKRFDGTSAGKYLRVQSDGQVLPDIVSGSVPFAVENVGVGAPVHRDTVVDTAYLRSVLAGPGIKVEQLADEIKISATSGSLGVFDLSSVSSADLPCGSSQTLFPFANLANLAVGDLMVWVMHVWAGNWVGTNDCMQLPVGWMPYVTPKYQANDYYEMLTAVAYKFATEADLLPATSYTVTMTRNGRVCGRVMAYRGANENYPLGSFVSQYSEVRNDDGITAAPVPGEAVGQPIITQHAIFDQTHSQATFPVVSDAVGPTIDSSLDVAHDLVGFAYSVARISTSTATVRDDENWIPGENYLASLGGAGWVPNAITPRTRSGIWTVFSASVANTRHYIERSVDLIAGEKYTFSFLHIRGGWNSSVPNMNMGASYIDPSNNERGFKNLDTGVGAKLDPLGDHGTVWEARIFPGSPSGVPSSLASISTIFFIAQASGVHKIRISALNSAGDWTFVGSEAEGYSVMGAQFRSKWRFPTPVYTDNVGVSAGSAMRMLHAPGWLTANTAVTGRIAKSFPVMPAGTLSAIKAFPYSQRSGATQFFSGLLKADRATVATGLVLGETPQPTYGPTLPIYPIYGGIRRKYYFELVATTAGSDYALWVGPVGAPWNSIGYAASGFQLQAGQELVMGPTGGTAVPPGSSTLAVNDVLGVSIDFSTGNSVTVKIYKNGVSIFTQSIAQNAATTQWHPDEPWTMWATTRYWSGAGLTTSFRLNFGGDATFAYLPVGFEPWDIGFIPSTPTPSAKGDLIVGTGTGSSEILAVGTDGQMIVANSETATGLQWIDRPTVMRGAAFVSEDGLTPVVPHVAIHVPQACSIKRVVAVADVAGNAVVAIGKVAAASYTGAAGANICGSDPVTLTSDAYLSKTTFTGWGLSVAADEIITIGLDSVSGINRLSVSIIFGDP
jgi:hypothetical protein